MTSSRAWCRHCDAATGTFTIALGTPGTSFVGQLRVPLIIWRTLMPALAAVLPPRRRGDHVGPLDVLFVLPTLAPEIVATMLLTST